MSLETENTLDNDNVSNQIDTGIAEEDDGLDSFFKKKDKRGKKKKSKKTDPGNTGKDASKPKKKEVETKKDAENSKEDGGSAKDHEEWIEYEDESQRDYSDLKIQNLQTVDGPLEVSEAPEYNEDGELIPPKPAEGPWKSLSSMQSRPQQRKPVLEKVQPAPVKKMGAYRPPQARSSSGPLAPSALPKRYMRKQQVPEIHNEFDFPSLANAVQDVTPSGFEVVKHGTKASSWHVMQQEKEKASELKLENQFAALNAGQ